MTILFEDSVITLEQWQNTKTALEITRSNKNIADFNLRYSQIKAPGKGRILKRFVDPGELINPGIPILLFGSVEDNWILRIGVPDNSVLNLAIGDSALVCFDAYPQHTFKALVSEIAAASDLRSGTFEVEVVLLPKDLRLLSGFIGKVRIFPTKKEILDIIPTHALSEGNENTGHVFVLSSGKEYALKRPVQIAGIYENRVLISRGLEGINEIIGDGASYLIDSTRVRLVN
jgi:RND family efflux transporter MFP subunit